MDMARLTQSWMMLFQCGRMCTSIGHLDKRRRGPASVSRVPSLRFLIDGVWALRFCFERNRVWRVLEGHGSIAKNNMNLGAGGSAPPGGC